MRAQVEMYADPAGRGGVLEAEGMVEIKFRTPELIAAMHRLDPVIAAQRAEGGAGAAAAIRAREAALLPVYRQARAGLPGATDAALRCSHMQMPAPPPPEDACSAATRGRRLTVRARARWPWRLRSCTTHPCAWWQRASCTA